MVGVGLYPLVAQAAGSIAGPFSPCAIAWSSMPRSSPFEVMASATPSGLQTRLQVGLVAPVATPPERCAYHGSRHGNSSDRVRSPSLGRLQNGRTAQFRS